MRRIRAVPVIALCCAVWWACTEGTDPTASGRSAAVGILPSFAIDPSLFASSPIDRIRLQARDAATRVGVGATDRSVSPTATQWSLSLGIDLGGQKTRVVIVEAELFSGSTVAWSGRLGPFTAPTSAPALAMSIYPGPLDNLDVLSLSVVGAPSQLVVGATAPLTAQLTLVTGSTASPVVQWASTNPTVATVTPAGSTVTLTALSAGTANIVASAGTRDFQFTLQVLPPGTASKTWVGGTAGGPRSWSVAGNWSPTGVPTASDDVLIPATANDPVLAAPTSVNGLTVSTGATLDLGGQALNVSANLRADGNVVNGQTAVTGSGTLLQGNVDDLLVVASRSATGPVGVAGTLVMTAPFSVGANLIDVVGDLATASGGRLTMSTAGGIVSVGGDAVFSGLSELGFLTAGQLRVDGDFLVPGPDPQAYVGSGTHSVSLNGTSLQTIDMQNPGATTQRFNNLFIDNTGGVDLVGDAYATGNVSVSSTLTVGSGQSFDIGGVLTLEAGSTLSVDGAVTATSCVNLGGAITGTGTHPCSPPTATRTWVGGASPDVYAWDDPNNWSPPSVPTATDTILVPTATYNPTLAGDVTVAGITITGPNAVILNGFTLSVTGDVAGGANGFSGGLLDLTGPGTVSGYVQHLQVSAPRRLAGTLGVGAELSVYDTLDLNANTLSVSDSLWVLGAGTLVMNSLGSFAVIYGDATFDGADLTGLLTAGYLRVDGDFRATVASPGTFRASGTHRLGFSGSQAQTVTFEDPGQYANDIVVGGTSVTFATDAHATGDLQVTGHMVVPVGVTVTVEGAITLSPGSIFEVEGTVTAVNGCTVNSATILGGGTQPCGAPLSGVTRDWIGGAAGDETNWHNPANWSPAGVPGATDTVSVLSSSYSPTLNAVASVASITVGGLNTLYLNGYTLFVSADLSAVNGIYGGAVEVTGAGSVLEGYFDDLIVGSDRQMTDPVYTSNNLEIQGSLDVSGFALSVANDLLVTGTGTLVMNDPLGYVTVYGTTTFGGGDQTGKLTAGTLLLIGDFYATDASTTSFVSSGSHQLATSGITQTLRFDVPGASQQHMNDLSVNYTTEVTLGTDAYASGDVTLDGHLIVPLGTTLTIEGTLSLNSTAVLEVWGTVTAGACLYASSGVVIGNGTQPCGTPVPVDQVWRGGAASAPNQWEEPTNWSGGSVPQSSEFVFIPYTLNAPTLSSSTTIGGLLVHSTADLDLGGNSLTVAGDVYGSGYVGNGEVVVTGTGSRLTGNLDNLRLDAPRALTGYLSLNGNADIQAKLTVGGQDLYVAGDLLTSGSGELSMDDTSASIQVSGTIDLSGLRTDLTAGALFAEGDLFIASPWTAGATVYLYGNAAQTLSLTDPGLGVDQQRFTNFYVANSGGTVTLNGPVYVTGTFYAASATIAGTGFLEVQGTFYGSATTFSGLPVRIDTNVAPGSHTLSQLTFTNYLNTDTQLYLRMPGSTTPLTVTSPVFGTVPLQNTGYYIDAANTVAGGQALTITLTTPNPTGVKAPLFTAGPNTFINWP